MNRTREQIAADIVKFAQDNNLKIHPGQEPFKWADLVIKKDGCPCVPGRNHCPCEFAMADIKELGRCRCGLFATDGFIEYYNDLKNNAKKNKGKADPVPVAANGVVMNDKARGDFLKKISINGFSIQEDGGRLTLYPRGAEATAAITIEDDGVTGWKVVSASGSYAGFARGQKRTYFESYINRWSLEAALEIPGSR